MHRLFAAAAAAVVIAGSASAASFGASTIGAALAIETSAAPGDLLIDPLFTGPFDAATSTVGVGVASGGSDEFADANGMSVGASTESSAPGDGIANADAEGEAFLFIENIGAADITFSFLLTSSWSAEAGSDGFPGDLAFASFGLEFEDAAGAIGANGVDFSTTVEIGDAMIDSGPLTLAAFDATLAPGEFFDLSLTAFSETSADSFGVVPLPAALPMMLAGLGALVALRRRA